MQTGKKHLCALLLPFFMAAGQPSAVSAQDEGEKKKAESIQIRVLCGQPVEGATELKLVQAEATLTELTLIPSMVSDPIGVARGELVISRGKADAETLDPIVKVNIPTAGKRFVLALFPGPEGDAKTPYRHVLIRTDELRFGVSDLCLFNYTGTPIGGTLGKTGFSLAPGKSEVVTPAPEDAGERMYQARFYVPQDGGNRLFSDTRWPLAASARVYLFFVPDPVRETITYLSFREYAPFE